MGQRVVSAFQAQFVPQRVNLFRLRLDVPLLVLDQVSSSVFQYAHTIFLAIQLAFAAFTQ
jgi:hypothetical protein